MRLGLFVAREMFVGGKVHDNRYRHVLDWLQRLRQICNHHALELSIGEDEEDAGDQGAIEQRQAMRKVS